MKSRECRRKIIFVLKLCFIACVIFVASYYLYYSATDTDDEGIEQDDAVVMTYWTYEDSYGDKNKIVFDKKYEYNTGDSFTISSVIPRVPSDRAYICFLTMNDTEVYINGELRNKLDLLNDSHILGGPTKNFYFLTPINRSDEGKTVTIIRYKHEGFSENTWVHEVLLGSLSDLYLHLFMEYGTSFIMYIMILFASMMIILAGLILRIRLGQSVNMIYAGVAVFMTAAWMITDSYFFPFFFGHYHIDGLMSYFLCLLLPIPYIAYLASLQKGRREVFYIVCHIIVLANFVILSVLHLTGIVKFYDSLLYIDVLLILLMIAGAVILFREFKSGHIRKYRYTAIGMLGFMIFSILEIFIILTPDLQNNGGMILLGLLFFLIFAVGQQFEDGKEADAERRRAMELSDAKTNFLTSMSHEIRTPINSILGMNEMILRENKDPNIESYARTVKNSGKMLLSLVNDVLDFSKIEAGRLEITNVDYDLSTLLSDINSIASERASQKSLEYTINIDEGIPALLNSDEFRIKQILLNLISNAVKYTDKGKVTLNVGGHYENDDLFMLKFDVEDTGRGIKEEDKETLFDAFSRIDLKNNRNIEGTGLGLAIVKSIVDSLGGQICLESEYLKGSVFSVILPQKVIDESPVDTSLTSVRSYETEKHVCDYRAPEANVLAVDDNGPNLSIVREFLKETGVSLDTCTNGLDALERCKEKKYDLILLDHMMPEPDGIVTLKIIRKNPLSLNKDTNAVVLTANAVAGSRQMYLDAGFVDYLTKPIDAAVLEETVKKYIPSEKIIKVGDPLSDEPRTEMPKQDVVEYDDGRMEFNAVSDPVKTEYQSRLNTLPEIDFETAMRYCAGHEDILIKVVADIVQDAPSRAGLMRDSVKDKDYEAYRIGAHSIKGTMATIGANDFSEKAKKHEYAVKEDNLAFVDENYEVFLDEFEALCKKLGEAL